MTPDAFNLVQTTKYFFARLGAGLVNLMGEEDDRLDAADLRRLAERHALQPSFASDLLAAAELAAASEKC